MGRLLARLLFDRTEQHSGQDLPSAIVPTRLVVRQSA